MLFRSGIGALLTDGIGDTIRVSLSEPPEAEIPVARKLVHHIEACREVEFTDMPSTYQGTVTDYTRETKAVEIIGGEHLPVVISCRKPDDLAISTVSGCIIQSAFCGTAKKHSRVFYWCRPGCSGFVDAAGRSADSYAVDRKSVV